MNCTSVLKAVIFLIFATSTVVAQRVSTHLPSPLRKSERYLFYLHGGVVTVLGNNAINQSMPEWGPYEYFNILDSLAKRGFNVISENRREGVDDSVYTDALVKQIDSLRNAGVLPENILVIGASAGSNIALHVSSSLRSHRMNYVIMGGCWPDSFKEYTGIELYGNFLSVIETSDPHGTCYKIFQGRKDVSSYQEIELNTGLSHGFIYKGYKEWIDPIVIWLNALR